MGWLSANRVPRACMHAFAENLTCQIAVTMRKRSTQSVRSSSLLHQRFAQPAATRARAASTLCLTVLCRGARLASQRRRTTEWAAGRRRRKSLQQQRVKSPLGIEHPR